MVCRERSSRRGNEQMRSKICDGVKIAKTRRRDFNASENPWNGARENAIGLELVLRVFTVKWTTLENADTQRSSFAAAATTLQQPSRVLV